MCLGPLDQSQISKMIKSAQSKIGEVQKPKEVEGQEKAEQLTHEQQDQVLISAPMDEVTPQEHLAAAAQSGVLSELKKQQDEDKAERLANEGFAERAEKLEAGEENKLITKKTEEIEALDKKVAKIKADVPQEKFEAAKKIVEGQIDVKTGEPAKSLREIKVVPETKAIDVKPAKLHPIMDIHDKKNQPMPLDM